MRSGLFLAGLGLAVVFACGGSDDNAASNDDGGDQGDGADLGDGGNTGDGTIGDGAPPPTPSPYGLDQRPSNTTCVAHDRPPPPATSVTLQRMWPNVNFNEPIYMTQAPGDNDHWYVVERAGKIRVLPTNAASDNDVKDFVTINVTGLDSEGGLLGFAFHPQWATNHQAYLSYTRDRQANDPPPISQQECGGANNPFTSAIARFTSKDNGATLDPTADEILLLSQPYSNHNGGNIQFGPIDGMLYIGFGDGGSGGDPCNHGQSLSTKFGKILRIDVNAGPGKYNIPPDNPFAGGAEPAIWSYGHRNPFRWSFDKQSGDLWVGDVGQNTWEEVDLVKKGGNYGWNTCEGTHKQGQQALCATPGLLDPVVDYDRGGGNCVIGGYVYRGTGIPSLVGQYIFSDNGSGNVWMIDHDANNNPVMKQLASAGGGVYSFGQGNDGEVYIVRGSSNQILKLVPAAAPPPDTFPKLLSQTGCVDPNDATKPASGVIPYDVISPLWSDGAKKERWLAIPDGTKIAIGSSGVEAGADADVADNGNDWDLPIGSVAMKTFSVNGKRVETRLFMRHKDGGWAGYSYMWNDQGTDANLLPAGATKDVGGGQVWTFPSRTQCIQCHSQASGGTIGLETWQLNRDVVYPSTNRVSNVLATLDHIGMFTAPLAKAPDQLPKLPDPSGADPLDARARSYLHANCSHCHRPQGGGQGTMDLRYEESFKATATCNATSTQGPVNGVNTILTPGSPAKSILSLRVHATDAKRMPPVAVSMLDPLGSKLLDDWITSITACPP